MYGPDGQRSGHPYNQMGSPSVGASGKDDAALNGANGNGAQGFKGVSGQYSGDQPCLITDGRLPALKNPPINRAQSGNNPENAGAPKKAVSK